MKPNWSRICLAINLCGFLALIAVVACGPGGTIYDERWNLHNVDLVREVGWHDALTHTLSAAGPLYTALHLVLAPITHLGGPPLRFPNVALLLAVVALTAAAGMRLGLARPWLAASVFLAVPFAWPVCGMALTEIPALIFCTAGILLALRMWERRDAPLGQSVGWAIGAGLAFGIACVGRQTYLLALAGLAAFLTWDRRTWVLVAIMGATALAAVAPLLIVWGGITPPSLPLLDTGLKFEHGVWSFAYAGLATLFVAPRWLFPRTKWPCVAAGLAFAGALVFPVVWITPARSLAERFLAPSLMPVYSRAASALLAALAALWLLRIVGQMWTLRHERAQLFVHSVLLLVAVTPIKISVQFSSRYVATGLTALILAASSEQKPGLPLALRCLAGHAIGVGLLLSYYRS